MRGTNRPIAPLPKEPKSPEKAPEFWGTYSIRDYEEFLAPVDLEVDIRRRRFEIEVDEGNFVALCETAKKEQKPIKQLASEILKQRLTAG